METRRETIQTRIPQGRTLRIEHGKGLDLYVVAGSLWVTYDNDATDFVLEPNETHHVSRNGVVLVHAFQDVELRIDCPAGANAPSLTLGGGYREIGARVVRTMVAEWVSEVRGWFVAGAVRRASRPGTMAQ